MEAGTADAARGGFGPEWLRSLSGNARRSFNAAFLGYTLDAFDLGVTPQAQNTGTSPGRTVTASP